MANTFSNVYVEAVERFYTRLASDQMAWQQFMRIRADEATASLPVVVLTAHAEEESRRRAHEGGADAFITKPFHPQAFRTSVAELLGLDL